MELSNDADRTFVLHNAVEHKNEYQINSLLLKNIDVNKLDKYNRSALHMAVIGKSQRIVAMLLEYGANPNLKEKRQGMTALHLAIKERELFIARLLMEKGANPNEVTKYNATSLHLALEVQDEELVKLTLEYGASIHAKKFGKSPLHLAVEHGNLAIAAELIRRGSNVDDTCIDGQTALHIAVEMKDALMTELLLANNARTDIKKFGSCPLYLAVKNDCIEITKVLLLASSVSNDDFKNRCIALELAFQKKNEKMVRVILEHGLDPNSKMSDKTPLHLACSCEWEGIVILLLERGADVRQVTSDNVSPLHIALEQGSVRIVELLIKHNADVNVRQHRTGVTPLHIAVKRACHESVQLLLAAGADANVTTNLNITALHLAFEARDREMIASLLAHGADPNLPKYGKSPLELSIECRWPDLARQLLQRGADPNSISSDQLPMIFNTIKQKNVELLQLLIEFKADINTPDPKSNYSPLMVAASCRCDEAAEVLIDSGADLDYATEDGTTTLHLALERRREFLVKLLLRKGANLEIKKRSLAPLHVAAECRWLDVAEVLLARGADVNELTIYFATPLFYAVEKSEFAMAKLLLRHGADVNYKWYGSTALHVASGLRQPEMVTLLLDWGARVNEYNEQDADCVSALHIALKNGDEKIAKILLERRASVKMRDRKMNRMPLHLAAESGCVEAARMLLARGAMANDTDKMDVTPLQLAAMRSRINMAELLLEHGAQVNARNRSDHYTSLHYAVIRRNYNMVRLLLAEGADVHCEDSLGTRTPFNLALQKFEDDRMLHLLLLEQATGPECMKQMLQHLGKLSSSSPIGEMLIRHLVRRKGEISRDELDTHRVCTDLQKYHERCVKEISELHKHVFYENVTLHTLLCKTSRELSLLARNESLVQAFEASGYQSKYPIYERILKDSMRAAQNMNKLTIGAENMLVRLFKRELPHLMNHMIINYLSNTDLRILNSIEMQMQ
ncbi:hypothetical protein TSAR_009114 [Trichomalopsis sarcophagae]|uniref:Uncharacterized protein n=1 Tax=Trichomalopsis sarcophagae TaxID=543379 RepID=A0A232EDS9_9HYME|nr:hypothetical protein TSAR_009114 [Trichomalopsis sarcophagae]